jgi:hypothetical protein
MSASAAGTTHQEEMSQAHDEALNLSDSLQNVHLSIFEPCVTWGRQAENTWCLKTERTIGLAKKSTLSVRPNKDMTVAEVSRSKTFKRRTHAE